jgi:capsid protein
VDPTKEAQAAVLRMNAGISTLEAECAEQGLDYEEVIAQRRIEHLMLGEAGLPVGGTSAQKPSGMAGPVTDAVDNDDDLESDETEIEVSSDAD